MIMAGHAGTLIVTGASRGIGASTAVLAASRGYEVAINYSSGRTEAEALVQKIGRAGGKAIAIQGNVAEESDVKAIFQTAERELGPIAGLVNNAGITGNLSRLENMEAADIARVFAINVTGSMLCAREAVRRMSTNHGGKGGAIVNIASRASEIGGANEWVHYAASKAAIDTFTLGLAREVAGEGIRVNAVSPGLIETGIHAAAGDAGRLARLAPMIPMKRAGTPDEVAEAILWLLSPAASYVTGAVMPIGGGR
jgi:NAD(P)-dependent dehydrogenase (short-subunit alcohol dehydrogenase family)